MTNRIQIVEVSPRDGLQADPAELTTQQKVELVDRLAAAGHTRIEAASFVSPRAVPKMADGEAVLAGVDRSNGVTYSALALNLRGVERALQAGVDEVTGVVIASETFSERNQRATIAEAVERWRLIAEAAHQAGVKATVTISAAFGCPFEGRVPPDRVIALTEQVAESHPAEIALADTIGVGVPNRVGDLFAAIADRLGGISLRGHFHNTRNTAPANIVAAAQAGVTIFDSSSGGVGGCPFAPRATGNVATEDVVYLLHEMGYDTGIDLDAAIEVAGWLQDQLGHSVPGLVAKAGGFPE